MISTGKIYPFAIRNGQSVGTDEFLLVNVCEKGRYVKDNRVFVVKPIRYYLEILCFLQSDNRGIYLDFLDVQI